MVIGLQFCLRLKVNYYIQNQTLGIYITLRIASLPYSLLSWTQLNNIHISNTRLLKKN